jgi:hypothetical protein
MSNAKQIPIPRLFEILGFRVEKVNAKNKYAFSYGTTKDAYGKKVYDKVVTATGDTERNARANASAKLLGMYGHTGFHIGDKIQIV